MRCPFCHDPNATRTAGCDGCGADAWEVRNSARMFETFAPRTDPTLARLRATGRTRDAGRAFTLPEAEAEAEEAETLRAEEAHYEDCDPRGPTCDPDRPDDPGTDPR